MQLTRTIRIALLLCAFAPALSAQQGAGALQKLVPPLPTPASFIADAPGILSPAAHQAIDEQIRSVQSGGFGDIAVAILPSIGDYTPNQVAVEIYRNWKVGSVAAIGSAHRDVGVLLLIVPKELAPDKKGQCYILTGTGAEGIITDAVSGTICRETIIPRLKEKDYDGAVRDGVAALAGRLGQDEGLATAGSAGEIEAPPAKHQGSFPFLPIFGGGGLIVAGIFALRSWRRNRARNCPQCGKPMARLSEVVDDKELTAGQRVEETIDSVDYDVWMCGCGGHEIIPYRKWFTRYSQCRECANRTAWSTRRVIIPPTTHSSGIAENRWQCKACPAHWTEQIVLPQISESSSSSSGGGGGGGGSSFGGSGSTSGGGGGGSY